MKRQWLRAVGLWSRHRQARRHHVWRERKVCWGELVPLDGSHHDWLEGRGLWLNAFRALPKRTVLSCEEQDIAIVR